MVIKDIELKEGDELWVSLPNKRYIEFVVVNDLLKQVELNQTHFKKDTIIYKLVK